MTDVVLFKSKIWEFQEGMATENYYDLTSLDVNTPHLNSRPYQTTVIREIVRRLVHLPKSSGKTNQTFIRDDAGVLKKIFPEADISTVLQDRVNEALEAIFELHDVGAALTTKVTPVKGKAGSGWKIVTTGGNLP